MKSILIVSITLLFGFSVHAQNWTTDIELAKTEAAKNNLPIVLVFQGSDWCAPCMKLDREIWSTEAFETYAENHYILLKADFPKRKQNALSEAQQTHNDNLAEKYNTDGYFPLVVVLDTDGKVLGKTGYQKVSPEEYIEIINGYLPKI